MERKTEIPKDAKLEESGLLAEGEATGHSHVAHGEGVKVFKSGEKIFLQAPKGCDISHQEHNVVQIPKERVEHRVGKVVEYDHFAEEARKVVD